MLKKLLEHLVKQVVDAPEEVEIRETRVEGVDTLEVYVADDDLGKVIGKEGKTSRSIRTLVYAAAAQAKKTVNVVLMSESDDDDEVGDDFDDSMDD